MPLVTSDEKPAAKMQLPPCKGISQRLIKDWKSELEKPSTWGLRLSQARMGNNLAKQKREADFFFLFLDRGESIPLASPEPHPPCPLCLSC